MEGDRRFLFDERFTGHQDWDFTLQAGALTQNFCFIPTPLTIRYKDSLDSSSLDWQYSQVSFHFDNNTASYFFQRVVLKRAYFSVRFRGVFFNPLFVRSFFNNPYNCVKSTGHFLIKTIKHKLRLKKVLKICKKLNEQKIMIWGANDYAKFLIDYLGTQISIVAIIDSSVSQTNNLFLGINLMGIQSISKEDLMNVDAIVLATDKHVKSMNDELAVVLPEGLEKIVRL
jgi:FlaA1/EpsC-like NDP-sugar epimerase